MITTNKSAVFTAGNLEGIVTPQLSDEEWGARVNLLNHFAERFTPQHVALLCDTLRHQPPLRFYVYTCLLNSTMRFETASDDEIPTVSEVELVELFEQADAVEPVAADYNGCSLAGFIISQGRDGFLISLARFPDRSVLTSLQDKAQADAHLASIGLA